MKHSFLLQCTGLIRTIMDVKIRLQKCPGPKIMDSALEKTLMLGKKRKEEKGMTEDEMVGWHHQLNEYEF